MHAQKDRSLRGDIKETEFPEAPIYFVETNAS